VFGNLDLSYNEFDYQGWLVITFFVLFDNLKSINFSGKFVVSNEFTRIGKSIALNLPNSLEVGKQPGCYDKLAVRTKIA
jgi:hypothetical protein